MLLRRIKTQKLFYELKLATLESKLRGKTAEVGEMHQQLASLQNTLASEQYKSGRVGE